MFKQTERAYKIIRKCLHYSVLVTLLIVICTGFIGAIAAQKLLVAYEGNCVLSVEIYFETKDNETATDIQTITVLPITTSTTTIMSTLSPTISENSSVTSISTTEISLRSNGVESETKNKTQKHPHIYRALGKKKDKKDIAIKRKHLQVDGIPLESEADVHHLTTTEIDFYKTHWGHYTQCEYFVFYPLFTAIVAILWGTMIFMFRGKGQEDFDWGIPKPWRIVLPSIVLFTLMSAFSLAYIIYIEPLKKDFCNMLRVNLTTSKIECGNLLQNFQPVVPDGFSTKTNYDLSTLMPRINVISWVIALIIMLARFFFAVDFQLVKVTISTYKEDAEGSNASTPSKGDYEEKVIRLHDDTKPTPQLDKKSSQFSSKDDLDDFESAHSETEMTTFSASGPSSLEPLLNKSTTPKVTHTDGI